MNRIIKKWMPRLLILLLLATAVPKQTEAADRIISNVNQTNVNQTLPLKLTGTTDQVTAAVLKPAASKFVNSLINGIVSKEQFANFRNVRTGNIAPKVLYRCMNPLIPYSSKWNTAASYADSLLKAHHVNTVINLSDTVKEMKTKGRSQAKYYQQLIREGKVYSRLLKDNGDFVSAARKKEIAGVFRVIIQNKGPYAIHCRWGQGRTGMLIMLLECLMGADYDYLYKDFTKTFKNYDLVGKHTDISVYNEEFSKYMKCITGKKASNTKKPKAGDWNKVNLVKSAENYLRAGGMTNVEIMLLKSRLSKP